MNLVTDGLPALALGVEPAEEDVMKRPPYSSSESIFGRGMCSSFLCGHRDEPGPIAAGYLFWSAGNPRWQTILFTTLIFPSSGWRWRCAPRRTAVAHRPSQSLHESGPLRSPSYCNCW